MLIKVTYVCPNSLRQPRNAAARCSDHPGRLRIPFATCSTLWAGNLPTKTTDIAKRLSEFDAIFALGGKSLITILYSHGSAVPRGCDVFQMSADVRDLGRTYSTKLSVVGDIKASLQALLPLLKQRVVKNAAACATARKEAAAEQVKRR